MFTDNVDNLLAKVDIPYERTRGSGVFNEKYPAIFAHRNLIVVGEPPTGACWFRKRAEDAARTLW